MVLQQKHTVEKAFSLHSSLEAKRGRKCPDPHVPFKSVPQPLDSL